MRPMMSVRPENIYPIFFLFIATALAHFFQMGDFGLYEDDYVFFNLEKNWQQTLLKLNWAITNWPSGRPTSHIIPNLMGYLGHLTGGLTIIYLASYALISLNAALTYLLIRKFAPALVATIGGLAFCLFPADTTKILLIHSFAIQIGLTFTLLGLIAYVNGKRISPYVFAFLALTSYETTVLPLLLAPLFNLKLSRQFLRGLLLHTFIILGLIGIMIIIRSSMGETRIAGMGDDSAITLAVKVLSALVSGPFVSMLTFIIRPVTFLLEASPAAFILAGVFFTLTYIALKHLAPNQGAYKCTKNFSFNTRLLSLNSTSTQPGEFSSALRLLFTGLIMWPTSYLMSFTHWPPTTIAGRFTSVHISATLAAAITIAGSIWLIIIFIQPKWKNITLILLSIYFSMLAGFHYVVQTDYVKSWDIQRSFWKQVIELAPDLHNDSVILIKKDGEGVNNTKYIYAYSWASVAIPSKIYNIPNSSYTNRAELFFISTSLQKTFNVRNNKLFWTPPPIMGATKEKEIRPADIIILSVDNAGSLKRLFGKTRINNIRLNIRKPEQWKTYPATPFYKLFMGS